jgi:hypothetical protein
LERRLWMAVFCIIILSDRWYEESREGLRCPRSEYRSCEKGEREDYIFWFGCIEESIISRGTIWEVSSLDWVLREAEWLKWYKRSTQLSETTVIVELLCGTIFEVDDRSFAWRLPITREKYQSAIRGNFYGKCGVDNRMVEFLSSYIVDWHSVPFDRWCIKKDILISKQPRIQDQTRFEIVLSDDIFGTCRRDFPPQRVITVRIFVWSVREEFSSEFFVLVDFYRLSPIEYHRRIICLDKRYSWNESSSIRDKSITFESKKRSIERNKYEKEGDFFYHRKLSDFFEFCHIELILIAREPRLACRWIMFFEVKLYFPITQKLIRSASITDTSCRPRISGEIF